MATPKWIAKMLECIDGSPNSYDTFRFHLKVIANDEERLRALYNYFAFINTTIFEEVVNISKSGKGLKS